MWLYVLVLCHLSDEIWRPIRLCFIPQNRVWISSLKTRYGVMCNCQRNQGAILTFQAEHPSALWHEICVTICANWTFRLQNGCSGSLLPLSPNCSFQNCIIRVFCYSMKRWIRMLLEQEQLMQIEWRQKKNLIMNYCSVLRAIPTQQKR